MLSFGHLFELVYYASKFALVFDLLSRAQLVHVEERIDLQTLHFLNKCTLVLKLPIVGSLLVCV